MVFSAAQQQCLLQVARATIELSLDKNKRQLYTPESVDNDLRQPFGNFVTLKKNGSLRGCIGSIEAQGELIKSIAEHAWSAAFGDPRFTPLVPDELNSLHISISILSEKKPLAFETETELLDSLRVHRDGLVIEKDHRRATFLPSVWQQLPQPASFLQHLKQKAGIPESVTPDSAWRYTAYSIAE